MLRSSYLVQNIASSPCDLQPLRWRVCKTMLKRIGRGFCPIDKVSLENINVSKSIIVVFRIISNSSLDAPSFNKMSANCIHNYKEQRSIISKYR